MLTALQLEGQYNRHFIYLTKKINIDLAAQISFASFQLDMPRQSFHISGAFLALVINFFFCISLLNYG